MATKRGPKKVSNAHKQALAQGRAEGRAVAAYLEALRSVKPGKRGPRRDPESLRARIATIDERIGSVTAIEELNLRQLRRGLEAELAAFESTGDDLGALEDAFCDVAASYTARKGIDYSTWRDMGVSAATLRRAGITRSAR